MPYSSDPRLQQLVAAAASLWERAAAPPADAHRCGEAETLAPADDSWLRQTWQASLGNGPERLEARLSWQGLSWAELVALEKPLPAAGDGPLPGWALVVGRSVELHPGPFPHPGVTGPHLGLEPEEPLPFEGFWLGFLMTASQRLHQDCSPAQVSLLAPQAWQALERSLLIQLSHLGASVLEKEFDQVRPPARRLLSIFTGGLRTEEDATSYRQFLTGELVDGGLALLERWPLLARLAGRLTELWLESTLEFLKRLEQDLAHLPHRAMSSHDAAAASGDCRLAGPPVQDLVPLCSDRHNGGRSVLILTLTCGCRCVYKPRPVEMESAFQQLLAWCNGQDDVPMQQRCITVLDRGDYGWVEWVEATPCSQRQEVALFFERAGMLMALVHVLRGNDCHRDNLIAASQWPVLIDGETLLAAQLRTDLFDQRQQHEENDDDYSVLQAGFLPCWDLVTRGGQARGLDVSALGHPGAAQVDAQRLGWRFVNTDAMHQALIPVGDDIGTNLPILEGERQAPERFLPELLRGFEQTHRFLRRRRRELLAPESPLQRFAECPNRYLFRVTILYDDLIARSLSPTHLRCALTRSLNLDQLALAYLEGPASRKLLPLLQAEREALENLDIPYLQGCTADRHLRSGGRLLVEDAFVGAPYTLMRQALQQLDEDDLQRQLHLIRGSFQAQRARPLSRETDGTDANGIATEALLAIEPLSTGDSLQEACRIADDLLAMAERRTDDSLSWIGMAMLPNSQQYRLRRLGASLYDGQVGIGLFMACLAASVPEERYRQGAMASVAKLCRWVERRRESSTGPPMPLSQGIGGATGLGGLVYGLVRIADVLDSDALLSVATTVASWIDAEAIAADRQLDVIGGCAGAILGLLTLHERTGNTAPLQAAMLCGERLEKERTLLPESGLRAWRTLEKQPLTGFSHGAAGISLALLRLHAASGRTCFREAALEGIAFERSVFASDQGNWPDLRSHGGTTTPWYMVNWCHGAAGIGLARLAGLRWLDDLQVREEIDSAVSTTVAWGGQGVDHLCCGNMGRVQLLLEAGLQLGRPDLTQQAQRLANWMVQRARRTGYYRLLPDIQEPVQSPGFFQGMSGIGHGLLRLATAGRPVSVCQWR